MRYKILALSALILIVVIFFSYKLANIRQNDFQIGLQDRPIELNGKISVIDNKANGKFDLHIVDIFSNFSDDKALYVTIKDQIDDLPQATLEFISFTLPKSGYFNLKAILTVGNSRQIIQGVGFRTKQNLEVKFPISLDEIGIVIPEQMQDSFPKRINIIGFVQID